MKVDNINNPCNGISLRDSLQTQFRKFHLAFAPTVCLNINLGVGGMKLIVHIV